MNSKQRCLASLSPDLIPDRVPWIEQIVHSKIIGSLSDLNITDRVARGEGNTREMRQYNEIASQIYQDLGLDGIGCTAWTPTISDPVIVEGKIVPRTHTPGIKDWDSFNRRTLELPRSSDLGFLERVDTWFEIMSRSNLFLILVVGMQYRMLEVSVGFENMAMWHVDQPDLLHACADFFCGWTCETIQMILDRYPFDALWLDDDLAYKTSTFISPPMLREYVFPYHRRIVKLAESYNLPTLFHSDGNLLEIQDDLIGIGFSALHPLERMANDIRAVKKRVANRITIMGNVDIDFLERGDPARCYDEAASLIKDLGPRRYILSSGNCITENVIVENLKQMARAVSEQSEAPI